METEPTMCVAGAGSTAHDDLHAAVGRVVGAFAFLTIVVPDVVCVLLLKLHPCTVRQLSLLIRTCHTLSVDMARLNSLRQNARASSSDKPMP